METSAPQTGQKKILVTLWCGVLGSPLVWAFHLQVLYGLVKVEQHTHSRTPLYLTTAACAVVVIFFGFLSLRNWLAIRNSPDHTDSASASGRLRFLSLIGTIGSAFFTITIIATGIAVCFIKANWD